MQSEIKIGQRFKFILSENPSQERQAEACELPETEAPATLVFERGTDFNVYLDGCPVSITLLD